MIIGAILERWPSGLRRTLGKRVCGRPHRGFESLPLRKRISKKERSFREKSPRSILERALGEKDFNAIAFLFEIRLKGTLTGCQSAAMESLVRDRE